MKVSYALAYIIHGPGCGVLGRSRHRGKCGLPVPVRRGRSPTARTVPNRKAAVSRLSSTATPPPNSVTPSIISCHRILRPRGNWPTKPTAEQTWTLCPRKSAARLTMNSPSPRPSERVASRPEKSPEPLAQFIAGNADTAVAYLDAHLRAASAAGDEHATARGCSRWRASPHFSNRRVHRDPGSEKIVLEQRFISGPKVNPDADGV